jgi:hypothetical protein
MLGGFVGLWQDQIADIGLTGVDKGTGGKFVVLPPGYNGPTSQGSFVCHARTSCVSVGMRGFQVEGKPDPAVKLMKSMTTPCKGWFVLFRFYGPLEKFFHKTWKPDDIVEMK